MKKTKACHGLSGHSFGQKPVVPVATSKNVVIASDKLPAVSLHGTH